MPDEIKMTLPEGSEPEPQDQTPDAPEFTEVELEAMKLGWKPESEFVAKPGRKWKTAERFLEDKPLFDKIDEQHKHAKKLEKQVDLLREHYEKVEKAAFDRALAELKAERKQALEEGDLVRAEEIRDEIDERKQQAPKVQPVQPDPEVGNAMAEWRERNDWYEKDEDMTAFADGLGNKLLKEGKNPVDILEVVEKKIKVAFPHKFRNPNRDSAPRVEGNTKKGKSGGGDESFMSPEEIRFMETFLKSGAPITREEYIRDMKKVKGVK
jgi:hypothetical protein